VYLSVLLRYDSTMTEHKRPNSGLTIDTAKLKRIRQITRNLSRKELAELVGVTRDCVSKWENGARRPRADTLHRLAEALQVTVDELLPFREDED
jgi:transcriptional regulator with XRE-family HTH domain